MIALLGGTKNRVWGLAGEVGHWGRGLEGMSAVATSCLLPMGHFSAMSPPARHCVSALPQPRSSGAEQSRMERSETVSHIK